MRTVGNPNPVLVALAAAVAFVGCSDPYAGPQEVSGAVKLKGEALKDGAISFEPLDKQDTQSGAPITNGGYNLPRKSGLKPGKYLVRITSGDGKTPNDQEEGAAPGGSTNIVSKDRVPPAWNVNSKKEVTVQKGQVNKFDFDIPAK